MRKLVRYRPGQAAVIVCLAALVTACAAFAPLYGRAVSEAELLTQLHRAPVQISGLQLTSAGNGPTTDALDHETLLSLVPQRIRAHLRPPVPSTSVQVTTWPDGPASSTGPLLWRDGACRHLGLRSGRCPARGLEIAVSAADARTYDWHVGSRIRVDERVLDALLDPGARGPRPVLHVVGVYALHRSDYWYGAEVTGRSGYPDPDTGQPQHDDWLTARTTLEGPAAPRWRDAHTELDLPLATQTVGLDDIARLAPAVSRFTVDPAHAGSPAAAAADTDPWPPVVRAYSGLGDIGAAVARGRAQAAVTIPLLTAQLGLLGVVVLWLVLGAATEQRRPEVAVTRLRGGGARGARRLLLRELGTLALVGVPLGAVTALLASWVVRRLWLPLDPPSAVRGGFWLAVAGAALLLAAVASASAQQAAREPVVDLLRRVPARRTGWGLGALEAVVVVAAGVVVALFATGGLSGPLSLAAPSLLALVVGLVAAHALLPVTAAAGQRLLARGRVGGAVSALQLARRPATRRLVAIVTVAAALLVFSADAIVVGGRNRAYAAQQEVGAPVVLSTDAATLAPLRAAVRSADPAGTSATPVVSIRPPGEGATTTEAVLPRAFARVALFPGQSPPGRLWRVLDPPDVAPVRLVGTSARVRLAWRVVGSPGAAPVGLGLRLLGPDGLARQVPVGAPGRHRGTRLARVGLPCRSGCRLVGLVLTGSTGRVLSGTVTLDGMVTSSGQHHLLGPASHWGAERRGSAGSVSARASGENGLTVRFRSSTSEPLLLRHVSIPRRLPAVVTGRLPPGSSGADFDAAGLDAVDRSMVRVATLPRAPGAPRDTAVVNLEVLARDGTALDSAAQVEVWLARDDPAVLGRVRDALRQRGIAVTDVSRVTAARRAFDETAATWSLGLAAVAGGAALLVAALVLLVITATTWRLRARDLAGLRMSGLRPAQLRSIAVGEQLPVVALAVVLGSACGVVGAHLALPTVPLFASAPTVSTLDLSTAWTAVAVVTLAALVVLGALGWAAGSWVARRATLERVRESL